MNVLKQKITILDIAKQAGVAKSTVSRYLNAGHVKEETKVKIKEIIESTGYEPNVFARLKAKDSHIIGVIAPCLDSSVTSQVLMSIDATLRKENYISLIINTNHDTNEELRNLENLGRMNVDGIILNATQVNKKHYEIANRLAIPFVFVAQECSEGVSIINEDYEAGKKMGEYIADTGHQNILFVSVDKSDVAVGVYRRQGILDALKKHGVPKVEVIESDFSLQRSYEIMSQAIENNQPDMIICSTTKQLLAAYKALREKKLSIPDDVSVVGFTGQETSEMLIPKATIIQFDPPLTGVLSAQAMLDILHKKAVKNRQIVPYQFIEGDSVKRRKP